MADLTMPSGRTHDIRRTRGSQTKAFDICQVTAVHEVMHTMKTNLANIKNVLAAWDRPLMERKPKPVDRDEFERAHKAIKSSRYAEIKEGGKVRLVYFVRILCPAKYLQSWQIKTKYRMPTLKLSVAFQGNNIRYDAWGRILSTKCLGVCSISISHFDSVVRQLDSMCTRDEGFSIGRIF